jgi:hypothetical protein
MPNVFTTTFHHHEVFMKVFLSVAAIASVVMLGFTTPVFAGWGVWQTSGGQCALIEEGKPKGQEYVKQVESTHPTYKDALMRLQVLLKEQSCLSKPAK